MRILPENPFLGSFEPKAPVLKPNSKEQWATFAEGIKNVVGELDSMEKNALKLTEDAVLGKVENIHDVMIAADKARTAMNLTLEVRSKVIDAYNQITRMSF
ncbi:MAG: flagellar hook-basal body complex protein FliE [Candidatus Riflebacteria bacterium]|nr:flagellar hook-basal body complex protein FliE [Candidatus Riflebacteria bacterium]